MSTKKHGARAPRWLYDGKTPERLLTIRRLAKTVEERTVRRVAQEARMKPDRLNRDLTKIRAVAKGGGRVDCETERQIAVIFLTAWDRLGPSRQELRDLQAERNRARYAITPAKAASELERMRRLAERVTPAQAAA